MVANSWIGFGKRTCAVLALGIAVALILTLVPSLLAEGASTRCLRIVVDTTSDWTNVSINGANWDITGYEVLVGHTAPDLWITQGPHLGVNKRQYDSTRVVVAFDVVLSAIGEIVEFASERGDMGRVVLGLYECEAPEGPPIAQHTNSETGNETDPLNRMTLLLPSTTVKSTGSLQTLLAFMDSVCYVPNPSTSGGMANGIIVKARARVDGSRLMERVYRPTLHLQYKNRSDEWVTVEDSAVTLGALNPNTLEVIDMEGRLLATFGDWQWPVAVRLEAVGYAQAPPGAVAARGTSSSEMLQVSFAGYTCPQEEAVGGVEDEEPLRMEGIVITTPLTTAGQPNEPDASHDELDGKTFVIIGQQSGKCLDVYQSSTANSANVVLWTIHGIIGQTSQQWRFEDVGEGLYRIVNAGSGLCLDVKRLSTEDGGNIQQYQYNGGANQKWRIEEFSSGYYRIVSSHSGKCLDAAYNGTSDGTNIQQWAFHGGANQLWELQEAGLSFTFTPTVTPPDDDEQPSDSAEVEIHEVGTSPKSLAVDVFMHYLDRYYQGITGTPLDITFKSLMDSASSSTRSLLRDRLAAYKALPQEETYELYNREIPTAPNLQLSSPVLQETIREASALPGAPTDLVASYACDIDLPERVKLEWKDNSDDEDSFLVYRKYIPATSSVIGYFGSAMTSGDAPPSYEYLVSLPPNTEFYYDYPGEPADDYDQVCYVIRAAKDDLLGNPQALRSSPTNPACSYYSKRPPASVKSPDTDGDGLIDKADCCPCTWASPEDTYHADGCPDSDDDHVPDLWPGDTRCVPEWEPYYQCDGLVDACPNEPGSPSNNGCPTRYQILWMGMEILNNAYTTTADYGFTDPNFQRLLGQLRKHPLDFNEEFNDDGCCDNGDPYRAEEPYVIFSLMNGVGETSFREEWTVRWSAGDKIIGRSDWPTDDPAEEAALLQASFGSFEPDLDPSNSDDTSPCLALKCAHGIRIFPDPDQYQVAYAPIDSDLGLVVGMSLWERDYTAWLTPEQKEATTEDFIMQYGGLVANFLSCATGVGCISLIVDGFEAFIDWLSGSEPDRVEVEDQDDYMGTTGWALTDTAAWNLTTDIHGNNVVYPFYVDVPAFYHLTTRATRFEQKYDLIDWDDWFPIEMRARMYFCLCREGVSSSDITRGCDPKLAEPLDYFYVIQEMEE